MPGGGDKPEHGGGWSCRAAAARQLEQAPGGHERRKQCLVVGRRLEGEVEDDRRHRDEERGGTRLGDLRQQAARDRTDQQHVQGDDRKVDDLQRPESFGAGAGTLWTWFGFLCSLVFIYCKHIIIYNINSRSWRIRIQPVAIRQRMEMSTVLIRRPSGEHSGSYWL